MVERILVESRNSGGWIRRTSWRVPGEDGKDILLFVDSNQNHTEKIVCVAQQLLEGCGIPMAKDEVFAIYKKNRERIDSASQNVPGWEFENPAYTLYACIRYGKEEK